MQCTTAGKLPHRWIFSVKTRHTDKNTIAFDTPEKQAYLRYCIDQQYEEAKISIIADAERQLDLYDERDRRRALAKMNGVDYNAADNNDDLSEETSESESEESDLEAEEFRQRYTKRCSTFGHVVRFSKEQRERLRAYFDKQPRPTTDQRRTLASEMGLSEHQVMRWFNNERARRKKILRDLPDGGAE